MMIETEHTILARRFLGIPFRANGRGRGGLDCYGLVWLAYRYTLEIEIPSYSGKYDGTHDATIPALIARASQEPEWVEIGPNEVCQNGDVLVFRIQGQLRHCGIALDNQMMIHIEANTNVTQARFRDNVWGPRLAGRYRHSEVIARAK